MYEFHQIENRKIQKSHFPKLTIASRNATLPYNLKKPVGILHGLRLKSEN